MVETTIQNGAELLLISNASPYAIRKQERRIERIQSICKKHSCHGVYLNLVGGQDELVFDGRSFVVNKNGSCEQEAAHCQEAVLTLDPPHKAEDVVMGATQGAGIGAAQGAGMGLAAEIYQAQIGRASCRERV